MQIWHQKHRFYVYLFIYVFRELQKPSELLEVGLGDMAKMFISVDINNYHDEFQIFISFNFNGRFLLLSGSYRNQNINCGFK